MLNRDRVPVSEITEKPGAPVLVPAPTAPAAAPAANTDIAVAATEAIELELPNILPDIMATAPGDRRKGVRMPARVGCKGECAPDGEPDADSEVPALGGDRAACNASGAGGDGTGPSVGDPPTAGGAGGDKVFNIAGGPGEYENGCDNTGWLSRCVASAVSLKPPAPAPPPPPSAPRATAVETVVTPVGLSTTPLPLLTPAGDSGRREDSGGARDPGEFDRVDVSLDDRPY